LYEQAIEIERRRCGNIYSYFICYKKKWKVIVEWK